VKVGVVEPTRTGYRERKVDPEDLKFALAVHQAKLNRAKRARLTADIRGVLREAIKAGTNHDVYA